MKQPFGTFEDDERGFTLAELLVTILIVSILAVAAHGYFLQQRRKGWMAQVISATKNLASVQEFWVNTAGIGGYTMSLDALVEHGYNFSADDVVPTVVAADSDQFCLEVVSQHDATIVWHYDSTVGHPKQGAAGPSCVAGVEVASLNGGGSPIVTSMPATAVAAATTTGTNGSTTEGTSGSTSSSTSTTSDSSGSSTYSASGTSSGESSSSGGTQGSDGDSQDGSSGTSGSDSSSGGSSGGSDNEGSTSGSAGDETDGCSDGDGDGGGDSQHPSGRDRDEASGGSGDQGQSESDPDGDHNYGADKPGGTGGQDTTDQDGNNGGGNDQDFEDDNNRPDDPTQDGSSCETNDEEALPYPW